MIEITKEDFSQEEIIEQIKSTKTGCVVCFQGVVRDNSMGKKVERMNIEVYEHMALKELEKIRKEALKKYGVNEICVVHRHGDLLVKDNIVFIAVAAGHRVEAFDACRYVLEELKTRVPLWKKEYTPEGEVWVQGDYHGRKKQHKDD
jgi:molybdopterin synthase catalytic subunit